MRGRPMRAARGIAARDEAAWSRPRGTAICRSAFRPGSALVRAGGLCGLVSGPDVPQLEAEQPGGGYALREGRRDIGVDQMQARLLENDLVAHAVREEFVAFHPHDAAGRK